MRGRRTIGATLVGAALLLGACAGDDGPSGGTLTVFAAASLTDAFEEIGTAFEAANPGTDVVFNFQGSSALVTQVLEGAPADVVATADTDNMDRLADADRLDGTSVVFARNALQIAVATGNPKGITGLADLGADRVVTVLCAPDVPCGAYAREALSKAGVTVTPSSEEANVRAVVARVASGEADAGIAYVTDVAADDRVEGVTVPADQNVVAEYPLAVVDDAPEPDLAERFVAFVRSPQGQAVLADLGFLTA